MDCPFCGMLIGYIALIFWDKPEVRTIGLYLWETPLVRLR